MWGSGARAQGLDGQPATRHMSIMTKQSERAPDQKADDPQTADIRTGKPAKGVAQKRGEIGGPKGPEPTRYGDWEVKGRCSDF